MRLRRASPCEERDEERQQWVNRLRWGHGPTVAEVNAAAQAGAHAGRIGKAATVLNGNAELYAIYMYLKRVAARPRPKSRRVLVVSDSFSAMRVTEETWRGRGVGYRETWRGRGGMLDIENARGEPRGSHHGDN